jgi:hypothetical protein
MSSRLLHVLGINSHSSIKFSGFIDPDVIYNAASLVIVWLEREDPPQQVLWVHNVLIPTLLEFKQTVKGINF